MVLIHDYKKISVFMPSLLCSVYFSLSSTIAATVITRCFRFICVRLKCYWKSDQVGNCYLSIVSLDLVVIAMRGPIVRSTRLSLDYFLKYDMEFQRKKSLMTKNATEVILDEDVIENSFQQFKTYLKSEPLHTEERIRIFIWNLVRKIQDDHALERCAEHVNKTTIAVLNCFPIITGPKRRYSVKLAKRNYKDLSKFLSEEFFGADNKPSDCMESFLKLLIRKDSLSHQFLIARHYAILSNHSRIAFVTNLVAFPCSMSHELRLRFFKVLDGIKVVGDWKNSIQNNEFLEEMFEKQPYESDCPSLKSYWLLMFHRHSHHHVGIEKRTRFRKSPEFIAWLSGYKKLHKPRVEAIVRRCCTDEKDDPDLTQKQLVEVLLDCFPMFLTDLQKGLYEEKLEKKGLHKDKLEKKGIFKLKKAGLYEDNLLKYFCINPCDRLPC